MGKLEGSSPRRLPGRGPLYIWGGVVVVVVVEFVCVGAVGVVVVLVVSVCCFTFWW
jgi:hypothetical protein